MLEALDKPEEKTRELTPEEENTQSEIRAHLSKLTVEATRRFNAEDWINTSDKMVDLMASFENWDGPVLDGFQQIFDDAYDKVEKSNGEIEARRFVDRWNAWTGEATIKRLFRESGLPYKTSKRLDKNGIDGLTVFASLDESYFVFLQTKTSRSVPTGIHMMDVNEIDYQDSFVASNGETRKVHNAIKPRSKLTRLQKEGDVHDFCLEEAINLKNQFLKNNANKGIDPERHQAHVSVVLSTVGMEAQDMENSNHGWLELMKTVEIGTDKESGAPVVKDFKSQLIGIIDTAEKI